MKKTYESTVIINAAIEEEQIEATINRIQETITLNGGEVKEIEKWGRKRLAYTLEKTKSGYYVIFKFEAPTAMLVKLERMYQLDEYILRFITVSLDKFAIEFLEKAKAQVAAEKAETEAAATAKAQEAVAAENSEIEKK